jgi:hypothetical protein
LGSISNHQPPPGGLHREREREMETEAFTEKEIDGLSGAQTRISMIILEHQGKEKALKFIDKFCPRKEERAKWGR